jgi:hypothetical protein
MITPEELSVVYFLTIDDFRTIQTLEYHRRFRWFHKPIIYATFYAAPFIAFFSAFAIFGLDQLGFAIAIMLATLFGPAVMYGLQRLLRPILNPIRVENDHRKIAYFRTTFRADGVLVECDYYVCLHYWRAVEKVTVEDGLLRILLSGAAISSVNIPARIFPNGDAAERLVRQIEQLRAAERKSRVSDGVIAEAKAAANDSEQSTSDSPTLH